MTFIVSFLLIFSIIASLLSEGGVIVNARLREEVLMLTRERERKEAEVEMLRQDLESYERSDDPGESIFIENIPASVRDAAREEMAVTEKTPDEGFKGLSSATILLISLGGAIVVTAIVSFLPPVRRLERKNRKDRETPERKGGPSSYDDIDLV